MSEKIRYAFFLWSGSPISRNGCSKIRWHHYKMTACTWLLLAALFEMARDGKKSRCWSVGVGCCSFHTKGHPVAAKGMRMVCTHPPEERYPEPWAMEQCWREDSETVYGFTYSKKETSKNEETNKKKCLPWGEWGLGVEGTKMNFLETCDVLHNFKISKAPLKQKQKEANEPKNLIASLWNFRLRGSTGRTWVILNGALWGWKRGGF